MQTIHNEKGETLWITTVLPDHVLMQRDGLVLAVRATWYGIAFGGELIPWDVVEEARIKARSWRPAPVTEPETVLTGKPMGDDEMSPDFP